MSVEVTPNTWPAAEKLQMLTDPGVDSVWMPLLLSCVTEELKDKFVARVCSAWP